eukprot:6153406-Amphidinium_carterae.1
MLLLTLNDCCCYVISLNPRVDDSLAMRSHGSFKKVSPRDGGDNVLKQSLRGHHHRTIRGYQIAYSLRVQNPGMGVTTS